MAAIRLVRLLACIVVLMPLTGGGIAQGAEEASSTDAASVAAWTAELDRIEKTLAAAEVAPETLAALRDRLEVIRRNALERIADLAPAVDDAKAALEAIGAPPAEGEESAGLSAERKNLKHQLTEAEGRVKEAELIESRAGRMLSDLAEIRRERFAKRILARGPSPLSPSLWSRVTPELASAGRSAAQAVANITRSAQLRAQLKESALAIGITVLLAIFLAWPLKRWLLRRYGRDAAVAQPSFVQLARATLVVGAARALLPTTAAALIYVVFLAEGLLSEAGRQIAKALLLGFVFFTWTLAFFRASLSPMQPAWRIVPVPSHFARGVRIIIIGLALAFAVDIVLSEIMSIYGARLEVAVLRDFAMVVVLTALLLILMLRQRMWISEDDVAERPRWRSLRLAIASALVTLPILGAVGYVTLARFVSTQLVLSAGLILLVLVLHRLGQEFLSQAISKDTWLGERLHVALRLDEESAGRLQFWLGLAYDALLMLVGIVIALFLWGADRQDIGNWVYKALFGFKVGEMTISLVDLVVAVLIFVGLLWATRFLQRILAERLLTKTKLDPGVRQSIRAGVGYLGIVIAAAAGISALGIDLSNLAIIAGALSVGIGFGLQNVVNNFVSGLILLVERPVKVGDWVVVGDQQGYVRRIKVRATEIQTFDRASVFIPNSALISGAVTNWTYADKMGRVIIPIGVAYGSDTRRVRDILLEIGGSHPDVLKDPRPSAVFRGFGDSALNFELRCFLDDVDKTIAVTSDLCFAIDDAFRRAGIEIPFPQQDVHVKELGRQGQSTGGSPLPSGDTAD